jgi:hypothetical protein
MAWSSEANSTMSGRWPISQPLCKVLWIHFSSVCNLFCPFVYYYSS